MQNDILPVGGRSKTNTTKVQPMRSLRLRGYSLDSARERLTGIIKPDPESLPELENKATNVEFKPVPLSTTRTHRFWHDWSQRQKIGASVLSAVLIGASATGVYLFFFNKPSQIQKVPLTVKAQPSPVTVP